MLNKAELKQWGLTESVKRREDWELLLLEIDDRISLTETQYEGLKKRYESIGKILEEPDDRLLGDLIVFPQGSFRTQTVIRPYDRDDVDIDAVAYVKGGSQLHPIDLLDKLYVELNSRVRTGGSVKPSKRCVTIQYADESLPCHLDVTPAESQPGNYNDDGTGRLRVPDRPTYGWSPSNPKDFADWFDNISQEELNISTPEGYHLFIESRGETETLPTHSEIKAPNALRVAVRLMKRHRDIYVTTTNQKDTKPISVIITTLAAKAYRNIAEKYKGQLLSPLTVITETVAEMLNCFDQQTISERYRVLNPCDNNENFAEKWNANPILVDTFVAWHHDLTETFRYGYVNFPSRKLFREAITGAFGTTTGTTFDDFYSRHKATNGTSHGLMQPVTAAAGLTFPDHPIKPSNKPAGFA